MIKSAITMTLPVLVQSQAWLALDQAMPCLINPITTVQAGQALDFQLFNARNSTCEARLSFANSSFLPISWTVAPRDCAGDQIASFDVPCSSPNGPVAVQWYCTGQKATSCAMLNITGGSSDYEGLAMELDTILPIVACQNTSVFQKSVVTSWSSSPTGDVMTGSSCTTGASAIAP